jgi:excisionase family DNA binding protein
MGTKCYLSKVPSNLCGRHMSENAGDVLTITELASYLKIPKSTLYKLVREGNIPSQKIGRHWRFRKMAIDRWLEETRANDRGPVAHR